MKKKFICCYDYGQGSVWCFLYATSKEEIKNKYPELSVYESPPSWFTDEIEDNLNRNLSFDIDDEPGGFLLDLIKSRI